MTPLTYKIAVDGQIINSQFFKEFHAQQAAMAFEADGHEVVLMSSDDEPAGFGADLYGRPDPRTHPEYWTE